ncbi:hypothetical protein NPIL_379881 [Nephila pilipes]|uniref:Endonuclease/exonuclease/phosphatase domain-containing protein n=1 Tax=Nephila pilipes TaxID=299642 RepID=A0A8X6T4W6_NEPPI|nr:hypothetical protein NPIL_379881 [Nephila pilipes]
MNDYRLAEILAINVWMEKPQFRVYGIYSPPNNKYLNLDIFNFTRNTFILGDFYAASPNWGYKNRNQMGQTVKDFTDSNTMYDPEDPNTFIHCSGSLINPDLTLVTTNIVDQCIKTDIGDPGSGHRITNLIVELKTMLKRDSIKIKWTFENTKWKIFTDFMENSVKEIPNNFTHYHETAACFHALRSTKQNR